MPSTFPQLNNLSCQRHHRMKKEVEGNQEAAEVCKTYCYIVFISDWAEVGCFEALITIYHFNVL